MGQRPLPAEADLINEEGARIRMPVKGREGLVEMDVPTRQSYVLAVVEPEERTLASGITGLVRVSAWAVAPVLAGTLMHDGSMVMPLVIGAAMKISYDLLLWRAFRQIRPPEEMGPEDN